MTLEDIALQMTPGIGVKGAVHLQEHFGSAARIFAASADELTEGARLRPDIARQLLQRKAFAAAEREIAYCRRHGIAIVASSSWCTLHVGASAFMALSTAGQLVSSALIDRFGLFGMPVTRIRKRQLPGYALVLLGVLLVVLN